MKTGTPCPHRAACSRDGGPARGGIRRQVTAATLSAKLRPRPALERAGDHLIAKGEDSLAELGSAYNRRRGRAIPIGPKMRDLRGDLCAQPLGWVAYEEIDGTLGNTKIRGSLRIFWGSQQPVMNFCARERPFASISRRRFVASRWRGRPDRFDDQLAGRRRCLTALVPSTFARVSVPRLRRQLAPLR